MKTVLIHGLVCYGGYELLNHLGMIYRLQMLFAV